MTTLLKKWFDSNDFSSEEKTFRATYHGESFSEKRLFEFYMFSASR